MTWTDPYGRRGRLIPPESTPAGRRARRRIAKLGVGALHPACRAAYHDNATPCARCAWLLGLETDSAAYIDAHVDDGTEDA